MSKNTENNIPKIIHYCWFGRGEKSKLAEKCIAGWKKNLKGYEIIEWNEDNFDINLNTYVREAYEARRFAFVADYVRLFALYNHGGIYLDTDVEVLKDFGNLLNSQGFAGFEDEDYLSTAVIGSVKGNVIVKEILDFYKDKSFLENGRMKDTPNVTIFTKTLIRYNLKLNNTKQILRDNIMDIYPIEYFSPLSLGEKKPSITNNTITIHWFEGSWLGPIKRLRVKFIGIMKAIFGLKNYSKLRRLVKGVK